MVELNDRCYPNWTGDCAQCGNAFSRYVRPSRKPPRFCSLKCSNNSPGMLVACTRFGDENPMWKGDRAKPQAGRTRALHRFSPLGCEKCPAKKAQRHHVDGNTLNNDPSNIKFLCVRCHMEEDGRLIQAGHNFRANPLKGDANPRSKLKAADIPVIRQRLSNGETQASIASDYGVGEETIGFVHRKKSWTHIGNVERQGQDAQH